MDKKHKCELCGISYDLDNGFLNIHNQIFSLLFDEIFEQW
jgi:hypothetical protein